MGSGRRANLRLSVADGPLRGHLGALSGPGRHRAHHFLKAYDILAERFPARGYNKSRARFGQAAREAPSCPAEGGQEKERGSIFFGIILGVNHVGVAGIVLGASLAARGVSNGDREAQAQGPARLFSISDDPPYRPQCVSALPRCGAGSAGGGPHPRKLLRTRRL